MYSFSVHTSVPVWYRSHYRRTLSHFFDGKSAGERLCIKCHCLGSIWSELFTYMLQWHNAWKVWRDQVRVPSKATRYDWLISSHSPLIGPGTPQSSYENIKFTFNSSHFISFYSCRLNLVVEMFLYFHYCFCCFISWSTFFYKLDFHRR